MAARGVRWSGERCCAVMGLSYVEDIHLELHDNIPEDVHFVAETAFVNGIVFLESSGHEPVSVDNIPCEGGVF